MNRPHHMTSALLIGGLLLGTSCGPPAADPSADTGTPTGNLPRSKERSWEGPPDPGRDGTLEFAAFNVFLEESMPVWANSPMRTSMEYVRVSDPGALRTTVEMEASPPEGARDVVVTIIEDGLADDSVGAVRYTLHLSRQSDGTWRLTEATWDQRCQQGRGHARFTPELCR